MILDVHHVGIVVRSLEAAYSFYRDALALPVVKEDILPTQGLRAAMLSVGTSYLELLQPLQEHTPLARYIAEHGEGLHHVALRSDDVDSQVAALRTVKAPLRDPEPRALLSGRVSYLAPEAFDGALLQVVQPLELDSDPAAGGPIKRIDHVVLYQPAGFVHGRCCAFRCPGVGSQVVSAQDQPLARKAYPPGDLR